MLAPGDIGTVGHKFWNIGNEKNKYWRTKILGNISTGNNKYWNIGTGKGTGNIVTWENMYLGGAREHGYNGHTV